MNMTTKLKIFFAIAAMVFASIAFAAPEKNNEIQLPSKQTPVKPVDISSVTEKFPNQVKANEIKSNKVSSNLSDFIPITAIVAIILFIAREIFDFIKKWRQEKNKRKAISFLLAEELKINYWSQISLFRAYKQLAELVGKHPDAVYRVRTTRFDKDIFEYKVEPDDKFWSGHPIPKFINDKYKSLLPSLAELDINCANILEKTYEKVAELEHFRQTVVLFLANEDDEDEVFHEMTKSFIQKFTEEENDFYKALNNGHVALVKEELKEWRLR